MKNDIKAAVGGSLAGIANGLFGAGGGMILVPLCCRWIKMTDKTAFATSLAVVMPMSVVSGAVYLIKRGINFSSALPFLIGGLVGGIIGGILFKKVSPRLLRIALALFIIYGGIRSLFSL